MDGWTVLFLFLNAGISAWNAYSSGAYWTESKIIGGWTRFIVWCGVVMSAAGFTWVYLTLLVFAGVALGKLTPYWGEVALKLGYLIIILPVLGSGLGIWAHSVVRAYRKRSFGNIAIAGWNTGAQFYNTYQAARSVPIVVQDLMEAFFPKKGRSSKDSAAALLVVLLVILALCAGTLTTYFIASWADKKVVEEVGGRPRLQRA